MCLSTDCIRRFALGRRSLDVTSFSTASTTPSFTRRPIAVLRALAIACVGEDTRRCLRLCRHIQLGRVDRPIGISAVYSGEILARRRCCQGRSRCQSTSTCINNGNTGQSRSTIVRVLRAGRKGGGDQQKFRTRNPPGCI